MKRSGLLLASMMLMLTSCDIVTSEPMEAVEIGLSQAELTELGNIQIMLESELAKGYSADIDRVKSLSKEIEGIVSAVEIPEQRLGKRPPCEEACSQGYVWAVAEIELSWAGALIVCGATGPAAIWCGAFATGAKWAGIASATSDYKACLEMCRLER